MLVVRGIRRKLSLRIALSAIGLMLFTAASAAQDRGFGAGIILGEPTGLSFKGWVSNRNAIDAGVAWSFRRTGYFHVHGDYLWHFPDVFRSSERFFLFTGLGPRVAIGKGKDFFGIRFVGGVGYWPRGVPMEIFLEIAPILDLVPATELSVNGGLGVRYFF